MLYTNFFFRFIWPVHVHLKTDKLHYLRSQFFCVCVFALENILVALTREIGDGPCFFLDRCAVVLRFGTFSFPELRYQPSGGRGWGRSASPWS